MVRSYKRQRGSRQYLTAYPSERMDMAVRDVHAEELELPTLQLENTKFRIALCIESLRYCRQSIMVDKST